MVHVANRHTGGDREDPEQVGSVELSHGEVGNRQRTDPQPGPVTKPGEDQRADAAGDQTRQDHQHRLAARQAEYFKQQDRSDERVAEDRRKCRGRPRCREHGCRRRVPSNLRMLHSEHGEAATDGHQRCLWSDHGTQHEACCRCEHDAGQMTCGCPSRAETQCWDVSAVSREVRRNQPDQQSGEGQRKDRPPAGCMVVAHLLRDGVPYDVFERVHCGQEAEGDHRERDAQEGGEQHQHEIATVVKHHADLCLGCLLTFLVGRRLLGHSGTLLPEVGTGSPIRGESSLHSPD